MTEYYIVMEIFSRLGTNWLTTMQWRTIQHWGPSFFSPSSSFTDICVGFSGWVTTQSKSIIMQFRSVQFKVVSKRSRNPVCAPPRLSSSSMQLWKQFQCWPDCMTMALCRLFKGRSSLAPFCCASLLRDIDSVMPLAFASTGTILSSSTLQIFRGARNVLVALLPLVNLLRHFPWLQ